MFRLDHCNACGRFQMLKSKGKRCYDCTMMGYIKRSENIPHRVKPLESKGEK
jgi:hypothetical protein